MVPFQVWLEHTLASFEQIAAVMKMAWSWPIVESLHFIGLTLLLGSIGAWDLRLLGVATEVPIAAFHRLVPWAVLGFAINAATGFLFLATYPDQYVYNSAFHVKMLCLALAGINVAVFYLLVFKPATAPGGSGRTLPLARLAGAISLVLWMTVIVCGRMITFFRPAACVAEAAGLLAACIP